MHINPSGCVKLGRWLGPGTGLCLTPLYPHPTPQSIPLPSAWDALRSPVGGAAASPSSRSQSPACPEGKTGSSGHCANTPLCCLCLVLAPRWRRMRAQEPISHGASPSAAVSAWELPGRYQSVNSSGKCLNIGPPEIPWPVSPHGQLDITSRSYF